MILQVNEVHDIISTELNLTHLAIDARITIIERTLMLMKASLRITAKFDPEIAALTGTPGMTRALIVDDAANLLHEVIIEYAKDDQDIYYRRLNYTMTHMVAMKLVLHETNDRAQELLYKLATALSGSTLVDRPFDKSMFILGANDGIWDEFTEDLEIINPIKSGPMKRTRKPAAKKEAK